MNFRQKYQHLDKKEFAIFLNGIKSSPDTEHFLLSTRTPYFFHYSRETMAALLKITSLQSELDILIENFPIFYRTKLLKTMILSEVESTNRIENIISYADDIFSALNNVKNVKDPSITYMVNAYTKILDDIVIDINTLADIRTYYNQLVSKAISETNKPDGKYFRKGSVQIFENNVPIFRGFSGEANINEGMKEFIKVYNSDMPTLLKAILSHYIIETVHPFYDGSGRLGRYLLTAKIYEETNSLTAFWVSTALEKSRIEYQNSFKRARHPNEYGCLNAFVEEILEMLIEEFEYCKDLLKEKLFEMNNIIPLEGLSKVEQVVYEEIKKASVVSFYGITNEEIMNNQNISKRSLISTIKKFKEMGILEETNIGKKIYHRLDIESTYM